MCCASKESPLTLSEYVAFGIDDVKLYEKCIEELMEESLLMKRGDKFYWKGDFFPNERYSLEDLSMRSYKVILVSENGQEVLTIEDESYVFRDLHPGAIYLFEAETYKVVDLDIERREVFIKRSDVDYYTQSLKHTEITPLEITYERGQNSEQLVESAFGLVKVKHDYYSYKVIDTFTQEIRSRHLLEDIPIISFETLALWFYIPFEYQKELETNGFDLGGTIHAIEHAMIAIAPRLAQISRWDLGGVSIDFDPVKQQPIIYIYDAFRGGIGISELLFFNLTELLHLTYDLINSCSCSAPNGCPGCCLSPKCGNQNEPLDKYGALFLLKKILNQND